MLTFRQKGSKMQNSTHVMRDKVADEEPYRWQYFVQ